MLTPSPSQAPADRLLHPRDLTAWQSWAASHHRLRRLKAGLTSSARAIARRQPRQPDDVLATTGPDPHVLIVIDAPTSSQQAALLQPLAHLVSTGQDVAVLCPREVLPLLQMTIAPRRTVTRSAAGSLPDSDLTSVSTVLAVGHYLSLGSQAYRWAKERSVRFCVIQHGLLTPFMAPLPDDAHLLAWSQEDADFWISGRHDVTYEVVGSQLLWQAAKEPAAQVDPDARPVFLGQLHGIELSRSYMTRVSYDFCRGTGATYRPHPSEKDKLSRLTHALWERRGIEIDRTKVPLPQIGRPVVGVFSTGILEAAARGVPAWQVSTAGSGLGTKAPSWLQAFHSRYNMSSWGSAPTPRPDVPRAEPARAVIYALTTT
nr:hypothetical protein [Actinomyces sp.]